MSDTVKLIIDIPKDLYAQIYSDAEIIIHCGMRSGKTLLATLLRSVRNGTPLDSVKSEIVALPNANPSYWHSGDMVEREEVLDMLDNIGKGK